MWTRSDRLFRALAVLFVLGHPVLHLPALAQGAPALAQETAAQSAAGDREALRATLEERYEVLPIRDGVLLKPRARNLANLGVRSLEVSGATVAVNGEKVDPNVLRAWLGEEADHVLALLALPAADRRALFGLSEAGSPAPPAPGLPADADTEAEAEARAGEDEEGVPVPPVAPLPEAPDTPEEDDTSVQSGSQVNVGGGITVARGEVAEEAVAVFGPVRVDGEVLRDAVAVLGPVRINGKVGGEVVSVMGSVILGPDAEVMGDVTTVGGTIRREPGAKIHGSTSEVALAPVIREGLRGRDPDVFVPFFSDFAEPMELFWSLAGAFLLALLVCLVLLVARRPLERVDLRLAAEPWKAALVGVGALFLSVPLVVVVSVLLALTIVGCVLFLLYPFVALALAWFALLGYAAVAHRLGRWIELRFNRSFGSPYVAALIGVFLIQIWTILGRLLGLGGGPAEVFAFLLVAFGTVVQTAAWVVGFGAVLLARFGAAPRPPAVVAGPVGPTGPVSPAPYPGGPGLATEPPLPAAPAPASPALPESWQGPPPAER